jgi:hypothetical protein
MTRVTHITKEELEPVVEARIAAVEAAKNAETALKNAQLAELEFKVKSQQLYLNNGLNANCRIDTKNGEVTWPDEVVAEPSDTPEILQQTLQVPIVSKRRGKKEVAK